ncbi:MAG: hypothetical protein ACE5FU_12335 [Nitrospinota bacterium]
MARINKHLPFLNGTDGYLTIFKGEDCMDTCQCRIVQDKVCPLAVPDGYLLFYKAVPSKILFTFKNVKPCGKLVIGCSFDNNSLDYFSSSSLKTLTSRTGDLLRITSLPDHL